MSAEEPRGRAPFRSGRLVDLRAIEASDAPTLVRWLNDPEVTRFLLSGRRPINLARESEWLANLYKSDSDVVFAITTKDGEHVGVCGLHDMSLVDRAGTAGIFLGERARWGQGLGTDAMRLLLAHAFETLNLHRVELSVYENNPRALRSYQKLGFVEEGRLRKKRFKEGRWLDEILMSVLAEEHRGPA